MLIASSLKQVVLNMVYQHLFLHMATKQHLDKLLVEILFKCSNHLDKHPEEADCLLGEDPCKFETVRLLLKERCGHHDPLTAIRSMLLSDLANMNYGGDSEVQPDRYYRTIKFLNQINRELGLDCLSLNRLIVAPEVIDS